MYETISLSCSMKLTPVAYSVSNPIASPIITHRPFPSSLFRVHPNTCASAISFSSDFSRRNFCIALACWRWYSTVTVAAALAGSAEVARAVDEARFWLLVREETRAGASDNVVVVSVEEGVFRRGVWR